MSLNNSYHASKYTAHSMLLAEEEIKDLLPFGVYMTLGKVMSKCEISRDEVIKMLLKRRCDTLGFGHSCESFSQIEVKNKGSIARPRLPIIEIKPFAFSFSSDGKLLEGVFGKDSIDFGITLAFPSLFMDENKEIIHTKDSFREGKTFKEMRSFKRKYTKPASFDFRGKHVRGTFRIGRHAASVAMNRIQKVEGLILRGYDD